MNIKRAVVLLIWALFATTISAPAPAADIRIAAAANLEKALTNSIIPAFEKASGDTVTPTFGSTKLLATQLVQGAPIDVFVSADTATVDQLARQGLVEPATEHVYAIGRLVIWTRKDSNLAPRAITDLAGPAYRKIAIANPSTAPYGLAAQQALASAGITAAVAPKLAQAENIGQALQFAQSGNADAALTALSLVIGDKADPYVIVPDKLHAPISQSVAVVTASTNQALAKQFEDFLMSKACRDIWKQYGYELPKK